MQDLDFLFSARTWVRNIMAPPVGAIVDLSRIFLNDRAPNFVALQAKAHFVVSFYCYTSFTTAIKLTGLLAIAAMHLVECTYTFIFRPETAAMQPSAALYLEKQKS